MRVSTHVDLDDAQAAARRLNGIARRTPLLTSATLDVRLGARVYLKGENFQRGGSFKFRGAYNRIAQLSAEERRRGVVAYSSGNHAQGVALAAKLLDVPAVILMPSDAASVKLAATRGYGAEVVLYDRAGEDRVALTEAICESRGLTLVPPYDDLRVIAGAATATLELVEDAGELDLLVLCLGGGGLLSGACIAAPRGVAIYGVEPAAGDDWAQSLAAGKRVTIPLPQTIADGAQTTSPGMHTFPIVQAAGAKVVTVDDAALRSAMRFAFERLKIVIEPTGALALAAILSGAIDVRDRRVGVMISGGNVSAPVFADALAEGEAGS